MSLEIQEWHDSLEILYICCFTMAMPKLRWINQMYEKKTLNVHASSQNKWTLIVINYHVYYHN